MFTYGHHYSQGSDLALFKARLVPFEDNPQIEGVEDLRSLQRKNLNTLMNPDDRKTHHVKKTVVQILDCPHTLSGSTRDSWRILRESIWNLWIAHLLLAYQTDRGQNCLPGHGPVQLNGVEVISRWGVPRSWTMLKPLPPGMSRTDHWALFPDPLDLFLSLSSCIRLIWLRQSRPLLLRISNNCNGWATVKQLQESNSNSKWDGQ